MPSSICSTNRFQPKGNGHHGEATILSLVERVAHSTKVTLSLLPLSLQKRFLYRLYRYITFNSNEIKMVSLLTFLRLFYFPHISVNATNLDKCRPAFPPSTKMRYYSVGVSSTGMLCRLDGAVSEAV